MAPDITPLYLFGETFAIDIKHDSEYNGTFNVIEKSNGIFAHTAIIFYLF